MPLDDFVHAFPYGRVSKAEQAREGVSIANQFAAIGLEAERQPKWILEDEYVDVESGRKTTRINYTRLKNDIRVAIAARKRAVLVVWRVDRLGRDLKESIEVWDELWKLGVDIYSVTEGGLLTPTHYRLFAWMAQEESDRLSARVIGAWEHFERNLWHKPGKVAWGYRLRPATVEERALQSPNQVLIPDETDDDHVGAAPSVRELWQRYATGESMRSLAIWAAGLPDEIRGGRNLGYAAIRQILRSPIYAGRLGVVDDEHPLEVLERPRARWEPLIDDETWTRAVMAGELARRVPRQASGSYRLTGLLSCYKCGGRMSGRHKPAQSGYGKTDRYEYICNTSKTLGATLAATRCAATVRADTLEEQVITLVSRVLAVAGRSDLQADLTASWERLMYDERTDSAASRVQHLERKLSGMGAEVTKALRKFNRDEYTREEYNAVRDDILAEKIDVERELERLRGMVKPRPLPMALGPLLSSMAGWVAGLRSEEVGLVRDALAVLLVRVTPVKIKRGVYEVDLEWTPVGLWLLTVAAEKSQDAELVKVGQIAKAKWSTLTFSGVA